MLLYIDGREGSRQLAEKFDLDEVEITTLQSADIMFTGNGPAGDLIVGIEYKQMEDIVGCIKSGRFTGTQLPEMMRTYDISILLVEGIAQPDRHSGKLVRYRGKQIYGLGIDYKAYDNFLTSVNIFSSLAGKPCIVKRSSTEFETIKIIHDVYDLFQKKWDDHVSMSKPDLTKIQRVVYDLEVLKVQPSEDGYPKYWLRKALFQLERMGWNVAGSISDKFGTMESVLAASQKDFEDIDHVGKGLAERLYKALHGYEDTTRKKRKAKNDTKCDTAT